MRFLMVPSFSIVISTTSPSLRYFGSFIDMATTAGVPVDMMSPGLSVMVLLSIDIILLIAMTMLQLDEFWRTSSFTLVTILRFCGSVTSSLVVIQGPQGANVSLHLLRFNRW